MALGERHTQKHLCKMPSFSSSLLDAIYHSIDDPRTVNDDRKESVVVHRRNNAAQVEQELESLRRAIRIEKWIENQPSSTPRHLSSNSGSSTDSSVFSSESSVPKHAQTERPEKIPLQREGRFTRTKLKALKIYGDLKKAKEPISPCGRIANFLNSLFSPRNLKKNQVREEWGPPVRKSRSCLNKNPNNKSKRSVRFCPISVIVDECGQKKAIYDNDEHSPNIGSLFIKKNMDSLRRHEFREFCEDGESDVDDKSCASSDLFELENIIGRVGIGGYEQELPVYGTTSVKMNQAIASGLIM